MARSRRQSLKKQKIKSKDLTPVSRVRKIAKGPREYFLAPMSPEGKKEFEKAIEAELEVGPGIIEQEESKGLMYGEISVEDIEKIINEEELENPFVVYGSCKEKGLMDYGKVFPDFCNNPECKNCTTSKALLKEAAKREESNREVFDEEFVDFQKKNQLKNWNK